MSKENLGTFDCVTFAAAIYSTAVEDRDFDGLLDRWEESLTPISDPTGQPLLKNASNPPQPTTLERDGRGPGTCPTYSSSSATCTPQATGLLIWRGYRNRRTRICRGRMRSSEWATHSKGPGRLLASASTSTSGQLEDGNRVAEPDAEEYLVPVEPTRAAGTLSMNGRRCVSGRATDPEYVCQFGYELEEGDIEEVKKTFAFPGTVGWKTGYRFYRDAVFSISPTPTLLTGETFEDYCEARSRTRDTGQRYVCERRFDEGRFNIFRYLLMAHHVGMPKSVFACLPQRAAGPSQR